MNYIKYYKEQLKVDFDSKYFVIHHIDLNRSNNNIDNLVLLPKELHIKYHYLFSRIKEMLDIKTFFIRGNSVNNHSCMKELLEQYLQVIEDCDKWYDEKWFRYIEAAQDKNIEIKKIDNMVIEK